MKIYQDHKMKKDIFKNNLLFKYLEENMRQMI